jgi:hypothetical protein
MCNTCSDNSKDLSCASAAAHAIRNLSSFTATSFCTQALVEKLTTRLQLGEHLTPQSFLIMNFMSHAAGALWNISREDRRLILPPSPTHVSTSPLSQHHNVDELVHGKARAGLSAVRARVRSPAPNNNTAFVYSKPLAGTWRRASGTCSTCTGFHFPS